MVDTGFPGRPKKSLLSFLPKMQGLPGFILTLSKKISIPRSVIDQWSSEHPFITRCKATIEGGIGVVAFYDRRPQVYLLLCVKNDNIKWQAEVWRYGGPSGGTGGSWSHDLEITIQEDCVAVFGTGSGGAYVEAFDKRTGANLFSFSPKFWMRRRPRNWWQEAGGDQ